MKKILIAFAALSLASCSNEDYANLNTDPKNPEKVPGSFLFTGGTKALFNQMGSTSVNNNIFRLVAQHWTETQYITETNYNMRSRGIPDTYWNNLYTNVLYDLKKSKEYVASDVEILDNDIRKNQNAMITVIEVLTWQQLVDTFGNIPYFETLQGMENTTPKYDDALIIYKDLLKKIDVAYNDFNVAKPGFAKDFIYDNKIANWKKLAASIKFRLAMRLADVEPALSKTEAEDAYNKGIIASNSDNFVMNYENNNTNANPLYGDLVLSGRADFLPSDTFVDYLNGLDDPRRGVYFDNNKTPYIGGVYGDYNNFSAYTHIGKIFHTPTLKGDLLDFSEISFLLADAKERGYNVPLTADAYYTQAIRANMEYWNVPAADITTYIARPDVSYATAPGTWKEKIGKQFWIAMYNRGMEAWTAWRMYDAPALGLPEATKTPVPKRFTYPVREVTLNGANYSQAASAIGGDQQQTKLFWDKF